MRLSDFDVLTFDCYGTLIDWESGIYAALQPLLAKAVTPMPRDRILEEFAKIESAQEAETPAVPYPALLAEVHRRLADTLSLSTTPEEDTRFGASVPDWPAFPDSAAALRYLKQHYQLVILSNVDRASFEASNRRLEVTFDAIYTAQDVGSYKPDPANFHYLLDHLAARDISPAKILHTAQSLFHDHVPARHLGLATAWIDRRHEQPGWGATMPVDAAACDFRFESMAALAEAHKAELAR